MTVRIYRSSDSSAPVLSGQTAALKDLLKTCLAGTGTAYGSKQKAGWVNVYEATGKIALQGGGISSGMIFRIDDSASGSGGAQESLLTGYAAMSDVDTGTERFPTTGQFSAGLVIRKSETADATARGWILVADERTAYLLVGWYFPTPTDYGFSLIGFGDFESDVPGDGYNAFVMGRSTPNSNPFANEALGTVFANYTSTSVGLVLARSYDGVTQSVLAGIRTAAVQPALGNGGMSASTSPANSEVYGARVFLHHGGAPRGHLRGLWSMLHGNLLTPAATFSGFDGIRDIEVRKVYGNNASYVNGDVGIETSDTWDD
jgi:hypothetical protein